jgi:hypothetical protein
VQRRLHDVSDDRLNIYYVNRVLTLYKYVMIIYLCIII